MDVLNFIPEPTSSLGGTNRYETESVPSTRIGDIAIKGSEDHVIDEWVSIESAVNLTSIFTALYSKLLG